MTDTVDAVFNELKKQLSTFLLHTFVKRKQAASFDSLKNSCDGKSIVLQVDFSENATIAVQKEVSSRPLASCSGNDLHHLCLDQQRYQFQYGSNFRRPQPHETQHFCFHAVHFSKSPSKIPKHRNCQCFQRWANFSV